MARRSSKTQDQSTAPHPPSDIEKAIEKAARQSIPVTRNGQTEMINAFEAVVQKQLMTALAGSPHAQRQIIENFRYVDERQRERIAHENEHWRRVKVQQQRAFADYRAKHGKDPEGEILPHPDDIHIDEEKGVQIKGPVDAEDWRALQEKIALGDALLWQWALDDRRGYLPEEPELGEPLIMAVLLSMGLPKRLQWTDNEWVFAQMKRQGLPLRVLLKEAHQAWKTAGVPRPRGWRWPPVKRVAWLYEGMLDAASQLRDNPEATSEDYEEALRTNLGLPPAPENQE